ncbi:MAG TPA: hypothetical protein DDW49_08615 [Deltaproteobacteria bacterium]|nr:MAG: hypothetical protein A2048_03365 [Deltaproteobacteria bacterium GWA2_45_12]HBF13427.1 hypothetical protein [Deltaproteobacteria bacterium]
MTNQRLFSHGVFFNFLLFYPFVRFLAYNHYPLFTFEVVIPAFVTVCLLFIIAFFASQKQSRLALMYTFLIFWLILSLKSIFGFGVVALLALGSLILYFFLRAVYEHLHSIIFLLIVGILVGDILILVQKHGDSSLAVHRSTPVDHSGSGSVLYFILDEHIGLDGMPQKMAGTAEMRQKLADFYLNYGFTLFPKAYSNYYATEDSLPNTLNGTYSVVHQEFYDKRKGKRFLSENKLFTTFKEKGYDIHVYAPDHIDFCNDFVSKCYRYNKNSPYAIFGTDFPWYEKSWILTSLYLQTNSLIRDLNKYTGNFAWMPKRTGAIQVIPDLFGELNEDLKKDNGRTLYFMHILMPHSPYVYDDKCRVKPFNQWMNRVEFTGGVPKNTPEGHAERLRSYYAQIDCLNTFLAKTLEGLKREGLFDDVTLIVHGDHGSRIVLNYESYREYADKISDEDLIASHAALMAIKNKGQRTGKINNAMGSLTQIVNGFLEGKEILDDAHPVLYLVLKSGKDDVMVPRDMVRF